MTDTSVESGLPNVGHDENGNATLEWWRGDRKITMYPMDGMLLKVWGPNCTSDMDEVRLEDHAAVRAAFQWLHQAVPATDPAACSAADSRSLDAVDELRELLAWSYGKLHYRSFDSMDDALMLDRIKLELMLPHHSEGRS